MSERYREPVPGDYVRMPRELADRWLKLPALVRALGRELYSVYERRVIRVSLDDVEDVLVRMLGPKPRERKALRSHIRSIVDAGLLVAADGGVRLLCWPEDVAKYAPRTPQNGGAPRSTDGDRKVDRSSTDGDRKVDGRCTDGDRKVDGRCTQGVPTPPAKPAKKLARDPEREERDQRERHTDPRAGARVYERARGPARTRESADDAPTAPTAPVEPAAAPVVEPVVEPVEPDLAADDVPFDADSFDRYDGVDELEDPPATLATLVPRRFRTLYMERFHVDPATSGPSTYVFPERLGNTAHELGRAPLELLAWAFGAWADQGRPGASEASPYAAFCARFDRIVAPPTRDPRRGFMRSAPPEDFERGTDADEVFR